MKNKNLELVGNEEGYQVFKNYDGFLEGYKRVGNVKLGPGQDTGKDVKRIVTNQKTLDGFGRYVRGLRAKKKIKDIPVKASELPSLFSE